MANDKKNKRRRDGEVEFDTKNPNDTPLAKRLKRDDKDASLGKIYNNLSDEVQLVRIKAAGDLIKSISSQPETERDAVVHTAESRLIRGLCSGRKAARLGFSIALTELFRLKFNVTKHSSGSSTLLLPTLRAIEDLTQPDGNISGQQRRDHLLGRCFAYNAILQSDVCLQTHLPSSQWQPLFQALFALAEQKQWLRREIGGMLHDYITSPSGRTLPIPRAQYVIERAYATNFLKTPEGVGLWLTVQDLFPGVSMPEKVWHKNDPLAAKERQTLSKILLESASEDDTAKNKAGSRQPSPGFVWPVVFNRLGKNDENKQFEKFWDVCVAAPMFSASSSTERRALGLQILTLGLFMIPEQELAALLHPNIIRCILDQRAKPDNFLFDAAKRPLNKMIELAKENPRIATSLVQRLLEAGGSNFDRWTKSKTIETMVSQVGEEGCNLMLDVLLAALSGSQLRQTSMPGAKADAAALVDLLLLLVRSHKDSPVSWSSATAKHFEKKATWLERVLDQLASSAYSDADNAQLFQTRLTSCLNALMSTSLDQALQAPVFVVRRLKIREAKILLDAKKQATLSNAHGCLKKLLSPDMETSDQAFALIFALSMLQVYGEEEDAMAALEDLISCYETKSDDATTMLVELLLSFVSKPSKLFRRLAEQVFGVFARELTSDSLQSLIDILGQKESLSGQQELFKDQGEESASEENSDGEIDLDDASDVEIVNGEVTRADEDSASDGSDETSSVAGGATDVDNGDEEAAFDKKLADALGTGMMEDDDSDDDGSDMDDEQMMALEPHLTTIFKERQKKTSHKQEKKNAKENIVNFKNRVLDLLSIYVRSQHASVIALDLILPIITLVRTTTNKQTAEKGASLLQEYFKAAKKGLPEPIEAEPVFALLFAVHDEMRLGGSKLHTVACSRSSLFLAKVLSAMDKSHLERVVGMYGKLMFERLSDPKCKVQPSVFTEWNSWAIEMMKQVA
jgi:DNA polymerase phi